MLHGCTSTVVHLCTQVGICKGTFACQRQRAPTSTEGEAGVEGNVAGRGNVQKREQMDSVMGHLNSGKRILLCLGIIQFLQPTGTMSSCAGQHFLLQISITHQSQIQAAKSK